MPVAFHIWDGANGETGLRMSLSSWTFVDLHVPAPITSYLAVLLIVLVAVALQWALIRWVGRGASRGHFERFGLPAAELRGEVS